MARKLSRPTSSISLTTSNDLANGVINIVYEPVNSLTNHSAGLMTLFINDLSIEVSLYSFAYIRLDSLMHSWPHFSAFFVIIII